MMETFVLDELVASPVIVDSSADSISLTFDPTFSMMPAPFSWAKKLCGKICFRLTSSTNLIVQRHLCTVGCDRDTSFQSFVNHRRIVSWVENCVHRTQHFRSHLDEEINFGSVNSVVRNEENSNRCHSIVHRFDFVRTHLWSRLKRKANRKTRTKIEGKCEPCCHSFRSIYRLNRWSIRRLVWGSPRPSSQDCS